MKAELVEKYRQWKEAIKSLEDVKAHREMLRRQHMLDKQVRGSGKSVRTLPLSVNSGAFYSYRAGDRFGHGWQVEGQTVSPSRSCSHRQARLGEGAVMDHEDVTKQYRRWLPQRFATDLTVRFRLKPGREVRRPFIS